MSILLQVKDLAVQYKTDAGIVEALNGVSLDIEEGITIGLVGETGAGKTTLAKGIMRLLRTPPSEIVSGEIYYQGKNLLAIPEAEMRDYRGKHIAMVFQDPMTALNPTIPVGDQIAESLKVHEKLSVADANCKAKEMLEIVGINSDRSSDYPHQFSGGMRQRVVIAIALACSPKILLADEPTTALDVTIQAQVLELILDLKKRFNMATLFITHDLGVVAQTCEKVAIMYAGRIIEYGPVLDVFKRMRHPYSVGLFNSIPKISARYDRLQPIPGLMPDPMNLPEGCSFCARCRYALDRCKTETPELVSVAAGHHVACFRSSDILFDDALKKGAAQC